MTTPLVQPLSSPSRPWVKLCGVRDAGVAAALANLKPDAVGFNFYPPSRRFVEHEVAATIAGLLPAEITRVGVFVDASLDEILRSAEAVGLTAVQLHGDEPPETIALLKARFPTLPVIKAWRVGRDGLSSLAKFLEEAEPICGRPDAILVDANVDGQYGGTGQTAPWHLLRDYDAAWPPLILAGGLTTANVAAAIAEVDPWGVDTAGGIERSPGVQDPSLAAAFLEAARGLSA